MSSFSTAAVARCREGAWGSAASKPFSSSSSFSSSPMRTLLLCLTLTVVVLVAYNPVIHNGFLNYDDNEYITSNAHVKAGLTWVTVKWAFTTYEQANWHPITWLSHALDYELFGLHAAGHHYVNVLLHAVNVVLLFLLLESATGFRWRSLMVAALFALHPINVESVAWAAERKNVLSIMFFLLALYAYAWYARKPDGWRYAVVAIGYTLGLLAKPQVITFPLLLFLWDYWPLGRIGSRGWGERDRAESDRVGPEARGELSSRQSIGWLMLEKLPLLLLSAASAVMTVMAQKAGLAVQTFSHYSPLLRLETAVISYARYLGKAFWPMKLAAMYPHPAKLYPLWQVGAAVVLLLVVSAWAMRAREQRYLAVGWFWFLGSLVPMIGLVQVGVQAMADRYAYLPFIGLYLMVTWLAADWAKAHQISVRWVAAAAVSCLLALGVLTHHQVGYWHDSESLWQRTIAVTGDNYVAQVNLGDVLFGQGRREEAAEHFRTALAIYPNNLTANLNLGAYEDGRGNLPGAIEHYQVVAARAADLGMRTVAYNDMGFAYRGLGQMQKAKQCFEAALRVTPDSARAMTGLALIAQTEGDLAQAVREYSRAIAAQPTDAGRLLLAQALRQQGQVEEAKAIFESVARSSPDFADAQKTAELFLSGK